MFFEHSNFACSSSFFINLTLSFLPAPPLFFLVLGKQGWPTGAQRGDASEVWCGLSASSVASKWRGFLQSLLCLCNYVPLSEEMCLVWPTECGKALDLISCPLVVLLSLKPWKVLSPGVKPKAGEIGTGASCIVLCHRDGSHGSRLWKCLELASAGFCWENSGFEELLDEYLWGNKGIHVPRWKKLKQELLTISDLKFNDCQLG